MRVTVDLDDDVLEAVRARGAGQGVGGSEIVNALVREGLEVHQPPLRYRLNPVDAGLRIDVSNIAEALDVLEGPAHR